MCFRQKPTSTYWRTPCCAGREAVRHLHLEPASSLPRHSCCHRTVSCLVVACRTESISRPTRPKRILHRRSTRDTISRLLARPTADSPATLGPRCAHPFLATSEYNSQRKHNERGTVDVSASSLHEFAKFLHECMAPSTRRTFSYDPPRRFVLPVGF